MAREQPLTHYARNIVFDCTANLRFWPIAAIGNAEIHAYLIAAFGWIAELHLLQLPIAANDPERNSSMVIPAMYYSPNTTFLWRKYDT